MALSQPTLKINGIKRVLVVFLLLGPLLGALVGFARLGSQAPQWPTMLSDVPPRGSILASDGTILAEGPVGNRNYPQGELAAHVIGFSGRLQPDGRYGLEGLEYMYDSVLQSGASITTTIDPVLQAIAQAHLSEAALGSGAESGSVVALRVGTGEILAAASFPSFDPNNHGAAGPADLINRAFLHQYEPGSVMKPFVIAALLESGRMTPTEMVAAEQSRRVGAQTFRETVSHDPQLNAYDILRFSSNTAMTHLTERFTAEELFIWLSHFGFGRDVGMTSAFTRSGGMNPWQGWVPQDQASVTLGQSVSSTTLQLAALYSIFANDGVYVPPNLITGEQLASPRRVISSATARELRNMLYYTVETSGLRGARIPEMTLAGKTGTADVYNVELGRYVQGDFTLTFAGMFPADEPEVVMVVTLQRPNVSATATYVAAPLFQAIGTEIVASWGAVPPRNPLAEAP